MEGHVLINGCENQGQLERFQLLLKTTNRFLCGIYAYML